MRLLQRRLQARTVLTYIYGMRVCGSPCVGMCFSCSRIVLLRSGFVACCDGVDVDGPV
jgi:hypothetical protein